MTRCTCLPYCRCGWLRSRMAAKSETDHRAILYARCSPTHAQSVLVSHVEAKGGVWVDASAWGRAA
jgi:hypothetical protein